MLFCLRLLNRNNIIKLLNLQLTLFIKILICYLLFLNLRSLKKLKLSLIFVEQTFLIYVICTINAIYMLKIFVNLIIN